MYNVDNDITIEFYFKSARYKKSPAKIRIAIKKVYFEMQYCPKYPYWMKKITVVSDNGIEYDKSELCDFKIN